MKTIRSLSIAAVLGLVACAVQPDDAGSSANAITDGQEDDGALHVGDVDKEVTLKVAVDGALRADEKVLPIGIGDACNGARGEKESIKTNFSYVELSNAADVTRAVDLSIKGEDIAKVHLLAYASSKAPHTAAEADKCLAVAHGSALVKETARPVEGGPRLSSLTANGVVIAPKSSVYVLVATEEGKGDYSLTAKTIARSESAPDKGEIALPEKGTTISSAVMVSGAVRAAAKLLPVGIDDACGSRSGAVAAATNYSYMEFKNPTEKAISFDARISGGNLAHAHLLAYEAAAAPKSAEDADKCLTVSHGTVGKDGSGLGVVAGTLRLSDAGGKSINVPAKSSVFVLVATEGGTGAYKMEVRSDDEAKNTEPGSSGGDGPGSKPDAGPVTEQPEQDGGTDGGAAPGDDWQPDTSPQSSDDFGDGYYGDDDDYGGGEEKEITLPSKPKASGCSTAPRTASSPLAMLAGAFALFGLVRRRRDRQ